MTGGDEGQGTGAPVRKLEVGQCVDGIHRDVLVYSGIPDGMRPATLADLSPGVTVAYRVALGPDSGMFYTCTVTEGNLPILGRRLPDVYVYKSYNRKISR